MGFVIDSNAPYFTDFPLNCASDAVYMAAEDEALGNVFAVVYRAKPGVPKLSIILIGAHGTSGFVDMTLDRSSRYYGACKGLAPSHFKSPVRRALAIAVLRTYATMDKPLREKLVPDSDESSAGALGSKFRLVHGKFPGQMGSRMIDAGLISPKQVGSTLLDIVYEDSDLTIDQNNELVYLLGEQLEQLFDPLSEYSPEPAEKVYVPPSEEPKPGTGLDSETKQVQDLCEKLYLQQARSRGEVLDFLQTTLIPLRVEVLKGSFPNLTIARLNTVFPPTIDELFRVNNIFYQALRSAVPFGAFEVVKACGATIAYFFRACMRHEAATSNSDQLLSELLNDQPEVQRFLRSPPSEIRDIIKNHYNQLSTIRNTLDELIKTKRWSIAERHQVNEFYAVTTETVNAFDPSHNKGNLIANGIMTSGNVLSSMCRNWPQALNKDAENRRVVTIFDAVDILEPNESIRDLHMVFVVFSDVLLVCRPSESIPSTSHSGLHIPSVGDMLLHAMLNEATIDRELPSLEVVSWSPILDVHFASFDRSQHLFVVSPSMVGSYQLSQPGSNAASLVSLLAKAKITTKTRPFHLFRIDGEDTTIYSTVQELHGYREESHKTGVAIFLSVDVTPQILTKHKLVGAMGLSQRNLDMVSVKIVSNLGYNATFEVPKPQLQELIVSETSYLMTLALSSQNKAMLPSIISANKMIADKMINWASQRDVPRTKGHKRTTQKQTQGQQTKDQKQTQEEESTRDTKRDTFVIPSNSVESLKPISPNKTVKKTKNLPFSPSHPNIPVEDLNDVDEITSNVDYSTSSSGSVYMSTSEYSSEENEQRDVDNWYYHLNHNRNDNESLNSDLTDSEGLATTSSFENNDSIQIGGFLDRNASTLYNKNAGRAFPRIESGNTESQSNRNRSATESSYETIASLSGSSSNADTVEDSFVSQETSLDEDEDFSYLATLVNSASMSKLADLERSSAFPSLRETSLVRLGSYVVKGDKKKGMLDASNHSIKAIQEHSENDDEDDDEDIEATPRLGDGFVAAEQYMVKSEQPQSSRSIAKSIPKSVPESQASRASLASYAMNSSVYDKSSINTNISDMRGKGIEEEDENENDEDDDDDYIFSLGSDDETIPDESMLPRSTSAFTQASRATNATNATRATNATNGSKSSMASKASKASKASAAAPSVKFAPFVDIENENWLPSPIYESYKQQDPFSPKFDFIYQMEDGHLGDRGSYELAENWLAWNQAQDPSRPVSMVSIADRSPHRIFPYSISNQRLRSNSIQEEEEDEDDLGESYSAVGHSASKSSIASKNSISGRSISTNSIGGSSISGSPQRKTVRKKPSRRNVGAQMSPIREQPAREDQEVQSPQRRVRPMDSRGSFRRMVMSSSLHTLQLASFVNQLDQKASQLSPHVAKDIEVVRRYVSYIYKAAPTKEFERQACTQLCGCYMLLMRLQCEHLANGLLEIEWIRRTRVVELVGPTAAAEMWTH